MAPIVVSSPGVVGPRISAIIPRFDYLADKPFRKSYNLLRLFTTLTRERSGCFDCKLVFKHYVLESLWLKGLQIVQQLPASEVLSLVETDVEDGGSHHHSTATGEEYSPIAKIAEIFDGDKGDSVVVEFEQHGRCNFVDITTSQEEINAGVSQRVVIWLLARQTGHEMVLARVEFPWLTIVVAVYLCLNLDREMQQRSD